LNEFLYTVISTDSPSAADDQFAYVDPSNKAVQLEMEAVFTTYLKTIDAWLPARFEEIELEGGNFQVEASVIIPVKNRCKTIADAIQSALSQQTDFPFNVIVIDNHSTDGTTELIDSLANNV
jgi:cellulose synthase/poly-beta-1,6-N-acetylglucosamine synthase-like glycosyltransferase